LRTGREGIRVRAHSWGSWHFTIRPSRTDGAGVYPHRHFRHEFIFKDGPWAIATV